MEEKLEEDVVGNDDEQGQVEENGNREGKVEKDKRKKFRDFLRNIFIYFCIRKQRRKRKRNR